MGNSQQGELVSVFCGVDDGHDTIKLAVAKIFRQDGGLHIEPSFLSMPSKVFRGVQSTGVVGASAPGIYEVNGERFTVSDVISGECIDTRAGIYPTSSINRVLVTEALVRAGLGGMDLEIVTGLPISDYYSDAQVNTPLVEAKKANLLTATAPIQAFPTAIPMPNIAKHSVFAEGVAAVYHMAIRENGEDDEEFYQLLDTAPVGVIDIGGKTIDMAVVSLSNGVPSVDMGRTTSLNYGMLKVMEEIRAALRRDFDAETISPRAMLRVLQTGELMLGGQMIDVRSSMQAGVDRAAPAVLDQVRAKWGKASDMARIAVVGGGAYTLFDCIKGIYPHATMPPTPEYANASGMLKLSMHAFLQSVSQ